MQTETNTQTDISFEDFKDQVLSDYKIAVLSRECSLLGRREVLTGKAKFGIFGDGKELPQLAMARAFKNGDFRSGYYRDQTFMMAIGELKPTHFFAGLYAHTDIEKEPMSAGRQMGGHFLTQSNNPDGSWVDLTKQKNSSADISPTAGQMPRLLGLAQASKIYRNVEGINQDKFSIDGNEVAWGTIGNASTSEGLFFETFNAAGVLQVPMVISVWDDAYGISVPAKHQTTKENISEILKGFQRDNKHNGYEIIVVKGWDYPALINAYEKAGKIAREEHVPVLVHVIELTQPQGHSTSGSHERYKTKKRLEWEKEHDCNLKFRNWIIANNLATDEELSELDKQLKKEVRDQKKEAWADFLNPIIKDKKEVTELLAKIADKSANKTFINKIKNDLISIDEPVKRDVVAAARKTLRYLNQEQFPEKEALKNWIAEFMNRTQPEYSSLLYNENNDKATSIESIHPAYEDDAALVDGRVVLRDNFEKLLEKHPEALVFGEDSGNIGDVNQGLEGLQEKFGELRVADAGIREATILGQGIGMAMRGLRPIAEIQYLDYLLYAIQIMSDDLATLRYRTAGKQKAPVIVRTRGHRLEGIWHAGSPMGGIIHLLRGMYILSPRNMTKAAGFYNTLMETDEPALVIESLNGYRLKEKMPSNMGEFKTPIGVVETVKSGSDITVISYGSTLRIVEQVAKELLEVAIDVEVIDAQTLLPFDINHDVVESLKKTNRLLIIDEDVPGGCSAYLLQEIIEKQQGYRFLDSAPQTLTAQPHRPAYGTDGDYFSKPNAEDIFEKIYSIMNEANPEKYPEL
ncbi:Pyruvate/2-oxoglutarate/acetoin dehydrogenase complex, dehydrogenase (E1) component [Zhouia amylolytica]|uniref:3-methyl-2-oxobutanoate dehydrogenase (2-methylpropanoyl-transferring) n=1 Tax=Zhouia amylolytica TaxID=376730 RepID=A0A1I6URH3_9FLAO|nr:alpha-ketoacid dehydrogenase subunit alpha/beta [Zhouia amylolytica]SFT04082.1 Pyruvate/2-oxoglutarate/acetoin dehydrogenase complex, dehydrogenase (E1) component [Zhouia amylolytica]